MDGMDQRLMEQFLIEESVAVHQRVLGQKRKEEIRQSQLNKRLGNCFWIAVLSVLFLSVLPVSLPLVVIYFGKKKCGLLFTKRPKKMTMRTRLSMGL